MIGSLRGWTHFRPLLTTPSRILRSIHFACQYQNPRKTHVFRVSWRSGKLLFASCRPFDHRIFAFEGDFMVAGHGLMYIGPPVLGETSAFKLNNES